MTIDTNATALSTNTGDTAPTIEAEDHALTMWRSVTVEPGSPVTDATATAGATQQQSADKNGATTNTRVLKSTRQRNDYETRLRTFQATTFFAKPACLSPLLCARFGWKNVSNNMLECAYCRSALCIMIPSGLSTQATEQIVREYQIQLAEAHGQECPYRLEAQQYVKQLTVVPTNDACRFRLPIQMAAALPADCVALCEHPRPMSLMKQRIQRLKDALGGTEKWMYPKLQVSDEVQQELPYLLDKNPNGKGGDFLRVLGTSDTTLVLLALLGWIPLKSDGSLLQGEEDTASVSLECPVCFSDMELSLVDSDATESNTIEPHPKRSRTSARFCNPHDGHRSYCPFRCGFPKSLSDASSSTPIWKDILERLQREATHRSRHDEEEDSSATLLEEEEHIDQSFDNIRKILRSAVVDTRRDTLLK